ncbi:hypothetical protein JS536_11035 [Bifidobacterium sp. SO4]|nr:hypothetical protein [Bifidobacterium sp. SO4]
MFSNRTVGFYIGLVGGLAAIASLIVYFMYGNASGDGTSLWIVIPLLLVVAAQVITLFVDNDWIAAFAPAVCMVALCRFVIDSVYTLVGYFFNLTMFGDLSMMPWIAKVCVLIAITLLALIVSAFMRKRKA